MAKFETKFDLGQEVFYTKDAFAVEKGEIITIYFDGTFNNIPKYEIEYNGNVYGEDDIFLTESEAMHRTKAYQRRLMKGDDEE